DPPKGVSNSAPRTGRRETPAQRRARLGYNMRTGRRPQAAGGAEDAPGHGGGRMRRAVTGIRNLWFRLRGMGYIVPRAVPSETVCKVDSVFLGVSEFSVQCTRTSACGLVLDRSDRCENVRRDVSFQRWVDAWEGGPAGGFGAGCAGAASDGDDADSRGDARAHPAR